MQRTAGSLSSGEFGGAPSVCWESNEVKWEAVGVRGKWRGKLGCGVGRRWVGVGRVRLNSGDKTKVMHTSRKRVYSAASEAVL